MRPDTAAAGGWQWGSRARSAGVAGAPAAVVLLFLNVLDGLFTLTYLQLGLAEEANPLMRIAYERSPLFFMFAKLAIVQLGVCLLWQHRANATARAALRLGVAIYGAIVLYHVSFLISLWR